MTPRTVSTDPVRTDGSRTSALDWAQVGRQLSAELLLPGSAAYETTSPPAIARFSGIRPAAVVRCRTPDDVAQALALGRRFQLPMAVRSGGHDFAGRSSTTGLLIDLGPMTAIRITGNRVVVGPGVRLGDLYRALHSRGRTIPGGSGMTVGIGGLTLGGGFGLLGRLHGLTCDHLVSAQVVVADGRLIRCSDQQHPDLFWLLRGAGASQVGVVTELVFTTVPEPPCTVVELGWDYRQVGQVLSAWQDWGPETPDVVAASLLLTAPADPSKPAQVAVAGTTASNDDTAQVAVAGTTASNDDTTTRQLLEALIAAVGLSPSTMRLEAMSWLDARQWLSDRGADDDAHTVSVSKAEFFRQSLPPGVVHDLVDRFAAGRVPGEARELDFSPWAGAYSRVPATHTAFPHRNDQFLLKHSAVISAGSVAVTPPTGWLGESWDLTHVWGSGGVYPNFPDPDLNDPDRAYFGGNLDRVRLVRGRYDPDQLFAPRS